MTQEATEQLAKETSIKESEVYEEWLECPSCHYQWRPMVDNPVMCPSCKKRFSVEKNIRPIKIKHLPATIRQRKNPLTVRPFEAHEHGTTLCQRCEELNPATTTYAIAETADGKKLCDKHIVEACLTTKPSRRR